MADPSCSESSDIDRCAGAKSGKDGQKDILVAGSTALLNDSPLEAVTNFKSALEKMPSKSNQKMPVSQLILRYALCVALIKCKDYLHIAEATEFLSELIDSGYASKLPALYLALARAFYALNRFQKALEFIEKGLKALQTNSKVKQHSWPGLQQIIEETGKDILQKELLSLQRDCKNIQPPDALCGYDKCLESSSHVAPAREIYFTDPDFKPFLYLQCDAKCQFAYHDACWENLKNVYCFFKEPKDFLGMQCTSDKCSKNAKNVSVIICVDLIGFDGFEKPISKFSQTSSDSSSSDSTSGSPFGSPHRSSVSASLKEWDRSFSMLIEPKSEARPSEPEKEKCPVIPISETQASSTQNQSVNTKNPQNYHRLIPPNTSDVKGSWYQGPALAYRPPYVPSYFIQWPPHSPHCHVSNFPPVQHVQSSYPPHCYPPRPYPQVPNIFPHPGAPAQSPGNCVEVVVRNTSVLHAGTTLLVPVSNSGGTVRVKLPPKISEVSKRLSNCVLESPKKSPSKAVVQTALEDPKLAEGSELKSIEEVPTKSCSPKISEDSELLEDSEAKCSNKVGIKSVVEEFKTIVRQLAGKPNEEVSIQTKILPSCSSTDSAEKSMKQVVQDFQKLVHTLAGKDTETRTEEKSPKGSVEEVSPAQTNSMNCTSNISDNLNNPVSSIPFESKFFDSAPSSTPPFHVVEQPSNLQVKSKSSCLKEEQFHSDQSIFISPSIINSYCSSEEDLRCEQLDSSKWDSVVGVLKQCRSMNFGYLDDEYMNPELQCFGHPFTDAHSTYVAPEEIDNVDKDQAEFVFSYYQSIFDKNGPFRIEDIQETWKNTTNDLGLPEEFIEKYSSVSEFLLKSEKFAAIDDVIGTSDLLPDMFSKAEIEMTQSVSYLLFSQVSNPRDKDKHNSFNDTWKTKINNNNCDSNAHNTSSSNFESVSEPSQEDSDRCHNMDTNSTGGSANVDFSARTSSSPSVLKTSLVLPEVNGKLKSTSKPFVPQASNFPSKPEVVYMSDDDEEIESSLTLVDSDSSLKGNGAAVPSGRYTFPSKWSEGYNMSCTVDQDSQTDDFVESEKNIWVEEKDSLLKELSASQVEKDKLEQRIESLQLQMENSRTSQESQHSKALKEIQDKFEKELKSMDNNFKEIQAENRVLEQRLSEMNEAQTEKEDQAADLKATLDKVRMSHAKEINNLNNFVKRLQEQQRDEDELQKQLKFKDQQYIQLWKDFCEFKIKKFNQSCNDRINVLSQLRDMMSDNVRPTKSDIESSIEEYEKEMIFVTQKNIEVNEIHTKEMEKLRSGLQAQLPSVIDVPDVVNMRYPPEGAFEHLHSLLKQKQEEFPVSRNHFSPAVSRFYPRSFSNGLQPLSHNRENEGFSSMSNSSLFGHGRNEPSHLWNNTFSTPSAAPPAMSFDVNNSNGPHMPVQNFGSNPMMVQQSQLNLMMPFQSAPAQNAVQSMMGQTRSTPSPLSFSSVNGTGFTQNTSAVGAVGSKPSAVGAIQKPIANTAPNPVAKTPAAVPSAAPSQGAVPKTRVQTATASMTPILPTRPSVRPASKSTKTSESNYEKLMRNLQKMFPTRNDMELTQALKMARFRNGNTLTSLTHAEIVTKVQEILNTQPKQTSMGWEKFGQAAWGTAKAPVVEWEGGEQDECCICMAGMSAKEVYTLECKHAFHKECIRKWLLLDSVCPNCRTHSTMLDDFPPLGC